MINLVCNMIFYLSAKKQFQHEIETFENAMIICYYGKVRMANNNNFFGSDQWSTKVGKNWISEYWSKLWYHLDNMQQILPAPLLIIARLVMSCCERIFRNVGVSKVKSSTHFALYGQYYSSGQTEWNHTIQESMGKLIYWRTKMFSSYGSFGQLSELRIIWCHLYGNLSFT